MVSTNTKILVVDDELPICRSVVSTLADRDYLIDIALSGEEALKKDSEMLYDIVITDLMMPGISGIDLLKTVKKKRPTAIVIMITGYPSVKSAVESIKLGAFDYIPKPFTPNELRGLVSRALLKKRMYDKEYRATDVKEGKVARIVVPKGLYCIPDNTWIRVEESGRVRVGAHHFLLGAIENIESIEFPKVNEMRYQGEACVRIYDFKKQIFRLWTPVTGKIVEINEVVRKDYDRLLEEPYTDGWILLIKPLELEKDIENLKVLEAS